MEEQEQVKNQNQKIPNGTVVTLKSGGPKMTIYSYGKGLYETEYTYYCIWFDEKNNKRDASFIEDVLEIVKKSNHSAPQSV